TRRRTSALPCSPRRSSGTSRHDPHLLSDPVEPFQPRLRRQSLEDAARFLEEPPRILGSSSRNQPLAVFEERDRHVKGRLDLAEQSGGALEELLDHVVLAAVRR